MGAPKYNQFWKNRSKHGRDKLFETPELLLDECKEYFNWVDSKPFFKVEQIKKPYLDPETKLWVTMCKLPTVRPYTIHGLCIYLGCNSLWFNQFERALVGKEDQLSKDFSTVLTHVREIIYHQKFEGAVVGAFNASIIQRDLGLVEKVDNKLSGEISVKQITGMEIK